MKAIPSQSRVETDMAPPEADPSEGEGQGGRARRAVTAFRARIARTKEWLGRNRSRRPVIDVVMRLHERDEEAAGTIAGSAVAFRLFLFFVPTVLVVVAVTGFFAAHVSAQDVSSSAGVSGVLADQIELAFAQSSTARWTALLIGLLGMAGSGRSLAKSLVLMSALSWRAPATGQRATVRITGMVVGIMISLGLLAALVNRARASFGVLVAGVSLVGASIGYLLVWLALSFMLPRTTRDPGALLPGAAVMGVAMGALQGVSQLYLPNRIAQASSLYGNFAVTIVTLGWFFIIGRLAVFSMTINAVVYERFGSVTTFVFGLPLLRRLPERIPSLGRFFGLTDRRPEKPGEDLS
jgi:membrane protein